MPPFELPKNFKFKPFYPFPLPKEGEVGPSSSLTPPIVLSNDSPFFVTCDLTLKDPTKENPKKRKLYEGT